MKSESFIPMLSLQVFADGGAAAGGTGDGGTAQGQGVTAGAASQHTGAKSNPLSAVKYGIQEESAPAAEVQETTTTDPNAEFEKLIKGQYKQQYDQKVQDIIRKRLKGPMETVEKYTALQPVLEILAKKHGVDAGDIDALTKAIEADDSYFEQEAMELGMSVKQLKELRSAQRENADLRRQIQERQKQENAEKIYSTWMQQAEETKKVYPGFDLRAELGNSKFLDLLNSNIDVRTAYEVLHKDDIIPAAMQFAAKTVESKIASKIASGASRPAENGMNSGSAAVVKSDVSQLTKADRQEIIRRVARGEKIRF